jgi:hypothetical protein
MTDELETIWKKVVARLSIKASGDRGPRVIDDAAEIRTEYLQNTRNERYSYAKPLCVHVTEASENLLR